MEQDKRTGSVAGEVVRWMLSIIMIVVLLFLLVYFLGETIEISENSMYPTLRQGDRIIVEKLSYKVLDPARYDLVTFPFEYQENTVLIRRVIGLPGETVQIQEGDIYINGVSLQENYGRETITTAGLAAEPFTLGENEYFVLGDNRNDCSDSRDPSIGKVGRDLIQGRVVARIWPFERIGSLL